jgi:hypothetical protein
MIVENHINGRFSSKPWSCFPATQEHCEVGNCQLSGHILIDFPLCLAQMLAQFPNVKVFLQEDFLQDQMTQCNGEIFGYWPFSWLASGKQTWQ